MTDKPMYLVACDHNVNDLGFEVNKLIDEGYSPSGGITIYGDCDSPHHLLLQVMVKN